MSLSDSKIEIIDLQENTLVYVPYGRNGWKNFRYPVLKQELIKKITPKKTKVVTDNREYDRYQGFYEINEETDKIKEVSDMFDMFDDLEFNLRKAEIKKFSDEQVLKLGKLAEEIIDILKSEVSNGN